MVVLMGLPGAGKSGFYRQCFSDTHAVVSKDQLKKYKNKAQAMDRLLKRFMSAGQDFVVDSTNVTRKMRADLVELGHEYGYLVKLYYFPVHGISNMARNLEPPETDEGFDEMYEVRHPGGPLFEIRFISGTTRRRRRGGPDATI